MTSTHKTAGRRNQTDDLRIDSPSLDRWANLAINSVIVTSQFQKIGLSQLNSIFFPALESRQNWHSSTQGLSRAKSAQFTRNLG